MRDWSADADWLMKFSGSAPGVKMRMSESGILSWLDVSALGTIAGSG